MPRSITRRRSSTNTRKVSRPAQGNHTNDRYPTGPSAGGDNVNARGSNRVRSATNNKPRRLI